MHASHLPRPVPAAASVAIVALIGALLILGLRVDQALESAPHLISLDLSPPSPPPAEPPKVRHARAPAAKHAASPRNVRNRATAIVAPPIPLPLIIPPPVVTAPSAGPGSAANAGAARLAGPGRGAGGLGNGEGGGGTGGQGNGDGDGDAVVGPRQTGGKLSYRDLPAGVLAPGQAASVGVLYTVSAAGRVTQCQAERPSGYPVLDALACSLIEQRFRFRPARDEDGTPVRSRVRETHTWVARED